MTIQVGERGAGLRPGAENRLLAPGRCGGEDAHKRAALHGGSDQQPVKPVVGGRGEHRPGFNKSQSPGPQPWVYAPQDPILSREGGSP